MVGKILGKLGIGRGDGRPARDKGVVEEGHSPVDDGVGAESSWRKAGRESERRLIVGSEVADEAMVDVELLAIDEMVEGARQDDGVIYCTICGRPRGEGEYGVSLMGHGASCADVPECVAIFERHVREGSERLGRCSRCLEKRPVYQLKIRGSRLLICADEESCEDG